MRPEDLGPWVPGITGAIMPEKCKWKHTPNSTPFIHPRHGPMPGFPDEWTIGCCQAGTIRIEPRAHWKNCTYCGKEIEWVTNPEDPSLPQTVPRLV